MADSTIQFLLNDTLTTVAEADPNTSVLNYLRNDLRRCGTKEGCASGDCGACTVVIGTPVTGEGAGEPPGQKIHYKAVNACITFLPSLHGKRLITVEDLKSDTGLHPVQQAMVDCHASQCGFCTPGFVMSLYALHRQPSAASHADILRALSGNLCRCTGYRSILDAAARIAEDKQAVGESFYNNSGESFYNNSGESFYNNSGESFYNKKEEAMAELLKTLANSTVASLCENGRFYCAPTSIRELATRFLQTPGARLLAGGTDLALEVTQQHKDLEAVFYLGNIAELRAIRETDTIISIGAAATYSECYARLAQEYPELGALLERLGSLQIRNQGTIGGNIANASPIGDTLPVWIALGASVTLRCGSATRSLALEDFFLGYKVTALQIGEFIQSVEIPKAKAGYQLKIHKISKRMDDDISAVLGAFHIGIENRRVVDIAIAYGGMAATPKRASECEATLRNRPWSEDNIKAAMAALERDFAPIADVRAAAQYRLQVAKNLLLKCFLEMENPGTVTRVSGYA